MRRMGNRRSVLGGMTVLVVLLWCGGAAAQSLSDLDWEGFEQHSGGAKVQSHTDPFASGAVAADDLSVEDLQLTGIVYNSGESFALISGYLVKPGDRIAGFRVDRVDKDIVRLKRLDEVYILALGGGI